MWSPGTRFCSSGCGPGPPTRESCAAQGAPHHRCRALSGPGRSGSGRCGPERGQGCPSHNQATFLHLPMFRNQALDSGAVGEGLPAPRPRGRTSGDTGDHGGGQEKGRLQHKTARGAWCEALDLGPTDGQTAGPARLAGAGQPRASVERAGGLGTAQRDTGMNHQKGSGCLPSRQE